MCVCVCVCVCVWLPECVIVAMCASSSWVKLSLWEWIRTRSVSVTHSKVTAEAPGEQRGHSPEDNRGLQTDRERLRAHP